MTAAWREDDSGWEDLAGVLFSRKRFEQAEPEVTMLAALLELCGTERVLDLPCGQGRHALELARRGFRVTGVDRTAVYLEAARRRAEADGLDVELVRSDMRDFRRPGGFDVAINMFTSFGYFEDPADDRRVATNFLASLVPGGRLLMDLQGKEIMAARFRPREWYELDDGSLLLEERAPEDHWRRVRLRWVLVRDGERREHEFLLRLYSAAEIIGLLEAAGFAGVTAFGSLAGIPYDQDAERLVVVARKPAQPR